MAENVWIGLAAALLVMLQTLSLWILNSTHTKIKDICLKNEADHKELWKAIGHHGHTCCSDKPSKVYMDGV